RLCARIFHLVHVAEVGGIGPNEVEEGFGQMLRCPWIAKIIGSSFEQVSRLLCIYGSVRQQQRPKLHDGCPCICRHAFSVRCQLQAFCRPRKTIGESQSRKTPMSASAAPIVCLISMTHLSPQPSVPGQLRSRQASDSAISASKWRNLAPQSRLHCEHRAVST